MAKYVDNTNDFRSHRAEEEPVTLTAKQARQGGLGRPVLYVLIVGLILAAIAWSVSEYYGAAIAPPTTDPTTTSSVTDNPAAPITNDKVIDDNQPKGQPVQKSPAIQD